MYVYVSHKDKTKTYLTSCGKSLSFTIAQFDSDSSSVGHFVALNWNNNQKIKI